MPNLFKSNFNGVILILGGPGSGKTEISVNLALNHVNKGINVNIVDLDLVNPYFRTREVRKFLKKYGVNTILPPDKYLYADLPIFNPIISGIVNNFKDLSIIDVGGGGAGSKVLGSINFDRNKVESLFVVNFYRHHNININNCIKMFEEIEFHSKVKISGIIGNSNLINDTGFNEIIKGYRLVLKLSKALKIPIKFITIPHKIINKSILKEIKVPVLSINRYLVPPWGYL